MNPDRVIHIKESAKRDHRYTLRLYRFSWIAIWFGILNFLCFICAVLILAFKPPTILAVDENGKLTGTIEYLDASSRSDQEIVHALKHFLTAKMSLNRDTIYADLAISLSMMSPELREQELATIKDSDSIERIRSSEQRSYLTFANSSITHRTDRYFNATLAGELFIGTKSFPFTVQITGGVVPRSQHNTFGIQITHYKDTTR